MHPALKNVLYSFCLACASAAGMALGAAVVEESKKRLLPEKPAKTKRSKTKKGKK